MSTGPMRFSVSVRITHEATDDGPRPLAKPFRALIERDTREEAEAVVERFWQAAAETGMQPYLVTEIVPVRGPSVVAGQILPGVGFIVGETLADVMDLDTWSETRLVTRAE